MNLNEVRIRRTLLLLRIAHQRMQIAELSQALKPPAHLYDQGHALAHKIRQHPLASSLGGALFSMLVFRKLPFRKLGFTTLASLFSWWQARKAVADSKS